MISRRLDAEVRPVLSKSFLRAHNLGEVRVRESGFPVRLPVSKLSCPGVTQPCLCFLYACPLVGRLNHVEPRCHLGVSDAPDFDFDKEERTLVISVFIQPFNCFSVFIASSCNDPDDNFSILARSVRDDLAEVVVIGVFKLILNDDSTVGARFLSINVDGE